MKPTNITEYGRIESHYEKDKPAVDEFSYLHHYKLSIVHWHTIDTDSVYSHDGCVAIATPQYLLLKRVNFFADTNLNYIFSKYAWQWLSAKCEHRK